ESSQFPHRDLYIPLTTAVGAQSVQRQQVQLQAALVHRRLVIVGDPGSGKTTFLRRIAFDLAGAAIEDAAAAPRLLDHLRLGNLFGKEKDKPFPLLIRIAELVEHIRNCRGRPGYSGPTTETAPAWIVDFLNRRNAEMNWGLDPKFFARKLEDGSTMVLLD